MRTSIVLFGFSSRRLPRRVLASRSIMRGWVAIWVAIIRGAADGLRGRQLHRLNQRRVVSVRAGTRLELVLEFPLPPPHSATARIDPRGEKPAFGRECPL